MQAMWKYHPVTETKYVEILYCMTKKLCIYENF